MNRRGFLQGSVLVLAVPSIASVGGCSEPVSTWQGDVGPEGAQALEALQALARGLDGINSLGPRCFELLNLPSHQVGPTLLQHLVATGSPTLQHALTEAMRSDFEQGALVDVEGWQLSRTECLLAALGAREQGFGEARPYATDQWQEGQFVEVERWGPKSTVEGERFNPQPDGHAGIWVAVRDAPATTRFWFDGELQRTEVRADVVTSGLRDEGLERVLGNPGEYRVALVDTATGILQPLGVFVVQPRPPMARTEAGRESEVFCQVENWGPREARAGSTFNEQPTGDSAFWVRIACAPAGAELLLEDRALPTTVRSELVTARVPDSEQLQAGKYTLRLGDPSTGERVEVGTFRVD